MLTDGVDKYLKPSCLQWKRIQYVLNCLFSVMLVLILVITDFTLSDELEKGLSVLQVNLLRILNLS